MQIINKNADVLVIGGGIAGLFAAIKAQEQGAQVILADKGYAGKSGQTPYAESTMVFNPEWGHDLDTWMNYVVKSGEYLSNRRWLRETLEHSYERYEDMLSWGIRFRKNEDGSIKRFSTPPGVTEFIEFDQELKGDYSFILRKEALKRGTQILDHTMICELIMKDDRAIGAAGFSWDNDSVITILAKNIIICTGGCGFKPYTYPPMIQLTCDGEAMAYRAGAAILGKEFLDTHSTRADINIGTPKMLQRGVHTPDNMKNCAKTKSGRQEPEMDSDGNIFTRPDEYTWYIHATLERELAAHMGNAPVYTTTPDGPEPVVGSACFGMSLREADGLWPEGEHCESSIPGLYAAGDSLGNMENGTEYALLGSSTMNGAVTGTVAGIHAAQTALNMEAPTVDDDQINAIAERITAPLKCNKGFGVQWATQLLQNTLQPYFVSYIKEKTRMESALNTVCYIRDAICPRLYARDMHELRLVHEVINMTLSAEMRMRSALFRTESRGNHYREDYPFRDDENWLAWTKISNKNGEMKFTKVDIPDEWKPDSSIAYSDRYPFRFPGEEL